VEIVIAGVPLARGRFPHAYTGETCRLADLPIAMIGQDST
jgi:hypothetical protein